MKSFDLKKVLGLLGYMMRCPVCQTKANLQTLKVFENEHDGGEGEERLVVHTDCQKCRGSIVFVIGIKGPEVVSSASLTDLTSGDMKRFADLDPISPTDVLDLHVGLRGFTGDFVKLIKDRAD